VVYSGALSRIEIVDPRVHPDFDPASFRISPAPLTGYLDEGDVLDLADCTLQILHTPGHSPDSISLWDPKAKTVFSGDALCDGDLLDTLYHCDPATLRRTRARLQSLGAEIFHGGHYASSGKDRMRALVQAYGRGEKTLVDMVDWYHKIRRETPDIYADHDWAGFVQS